MAVTTVTHSIGAGRDYSDLSSWEDGGTVNLTTAERWSAASFTGTFVLGETVSGTGLSSGKLLATDGSSSVTFSIASGSTATLTTLTGGTSGATCVVSAKTHTGAIWRGELYDSFTTNAGTLVDISGQTTSSTCYMELTAATGQSFLDQSDVRTHALAPYDASRGVGLQNTSSSAFSNEVIKVGANFTRISRLQIDQKDSDKGGPVFTGTNCLFRECLFTGSVVTFSGANSSIINCVFFFNYTGAGKLKVNRTTLIGCSIIQRQDVSPGNPAIWMQYSYACVMNSCAVFGFTAPYGTHGGGNSWSGGNNATDNSSGLPGSTGNVHSVTYSATTPFTRADGTGTDLRPVSGSALASAGVLDSTNAPNDITGTARAATPTIGAWELAASGSNASLTATLGPLALTSSVGVSTQASLTSALGPLAVTATVQSQASASLTGTLGPLALSAQVKTTQVLYAKAAGGNWSSASTWSLTSSAGSDSAGPPEATTPYDVVFDAGSGNVTINANASCRSLQCTGYTGTLTHASGMTLAVGHLTAGPSNVLLAFAAGMTYSPADITAVVSLNSSVTATPQTVRSAGKTYGAVTHNGTGSTVLLDALTVTGDLIASAGTFDTAGFTVTCLTYSAAGTGISTWGASTINITRTTTGIVFAATGTHVINAGTSNLVFSTASTGARTFGGGGLTYYDLTYTVAGSTGALTITGANTFHTLRFSDASNARTLTLPAGATTTVTTFAVNGTAGKLMTVQSSSTGVAAPISAASNQVCTYLSLKDSAASGATFYAGSTSTNSGGNTGWLFTDPAWTLTATLGPLACRASVITEPYAIAVAADGAAGYWPLNEGVGATVALDYAGTRNGTLTGGVRAGRPGYWGRATAFFGDSAAGTTGHIDLGTGPPAPATSFTIDLWCWDRTGATHGHVCWAKGPPVFQDRPSTPGLFSFGVLSALSGHTLTLDSNGPGQVNGSANTTLPLRAWQHVAFVYTSGIGSRFYVNGVPDGNVGVTFSVDNTLTTWLGDFPFGADQGYGWDGLMQAVAWYPTALTDAQIAHHYAVGLAQAAAGTRRRPLSVLDLLGDDDMLHYNLALPITPSDSNNLARPTDAIYIGVSGDLAVVLENGSTRTFVDAAAGSILPITVQRVNTTNTTADSLLALYAQ